MFVEFNWTANCYIFRFGRYPTDWRGYASLPTLADVKALLAQSGCKLGKKTDTRTWTIESVGDREV